MKAPVTLAAFAVGLAAVFGAALAVGQSVGPGDQATHGEEHTAPGLSAAEEGYTLKDTSLRDGRLSFTIADPDGRPLTAYTPTHTKDLHLIVVRRDLTDFRHVHPTRGTDGTWTVPLAQPRPGPYRVFADFAPEGRSTSLVLAADLTVPGDATSAAPRPESRTATVDGYTVTLDGDLTAGTISPLDLTVTRAGKPVTLEPYLGAFGHLVALRRSDLAYLHVHPEEGAGLRFGVDVPSAASYALFLDFQHQGVVRTAAFTVTAHGH